MDPSSVSKEAQQPYKPVNTSSTSEETQQTLEIADNPYTKDIFDKIDENHQASATKTDSDDEFEITNPHLLKVVQACEKVLAGIDYVGLNVARFFGIGRPRYQDVYDSMNPEERQQAYETHLRREESRRVKKMEENPTSA